MSQLIEILRISNKHQKKPFLKLKNIDFFIRLNDSK